MVLNLEDRVAIVTGGSKGIGKAIAKSLAKEGAHVIICARGVNALESVVREIRQEGGSAIAQSVDALDNKAVETVIGKVVQEFGGLDIVVNNVGGVKKFADFLDLDEKDWHHTFELNVMTMVHFVKHTLPWLRRSDHARIINISSISGLQPGFYNPHYTVTKAATINLSKYLANKLADDHILVNTICPGPVHSDAWDRNVAHVASIRNISFEEANIQVNVEEGNKIPLGRVGEGDDVAGLVAFLASDKAEWITGSCFHVNGGKMRSMF